MKICLSVFYSFLSHPRFVFIQCGWNIILFFMWSGATPPRPTFQTNHPPHTDLRCHIYHTPNSHIHGSVLDSSLLFHWSIVLALIAHWQIGVYRMPQCLFGGPPTFAFNFENTCLKYLWKPVLLCKF